MAEPKLRTTQEQRERWANSDGLPAWFCADIETLLARVRELEGELEQAAARVRELEAERDGN